MKQRIFTLSALVGLGITGVGFAMPTVVQTPDAISVDTVWDSDTNDDGVIDQIYYMDRAVFVGDLSGATRPTLTITPGTVIAATGPAVSSSGTDVGSLVITRDGAINASGTRRAPIVFTSALEAEFLYGVDVDGDNTVNTRKPDPIGGDDDGDDGGDWGGVLLLGNAPINFYNTPTNNLNSNAVEGFSQTAGGESITYGGDDAADNSGVFRYVSIRFGGFEFAADEEINGLTMAGVGAGTKIDHVEVVANTDDGFEWFGGTVNTSHLFALYCQDESFDLDEGHQGTHQFWFAVQSNNGDNLTEADGGNKTGTGVKTGEPLTNVKVYNATYIGALGAEDEEPQPIFDENGIPIGFGPAPEGGSADVFRLKDNFAGQFHNGIFMSPGDDIMRIDDTPTIDQVGGDLVMTNNLFGAPDDQATHNNGGDNANADAEAAILVQDGNQLDVDPQFTLINRNSLGEVVEIDPRPLTTSPALAGALTEGAPFMVDYKGAFGSENWLQGWSYGSQEGIVVNSNPVTVTVIQTPDSITTDTTWDSDTNDDGIVDQIYYMDRAIFVGDLTGNTRPTLTIAPGTIIAATGPAVSSSGTDVGSLVVTRDGAINASGTVLQPIVFTSALEAEFLYGVDVDGDNTVNTRKPDPIGGDDDGDDGGDWGGVLLLGNAPINFYNTPTNNLNSNAVEGFSQTAGGESITYGGDDAADNSGVFRYVSIRFGGFEFAADEEINGLTMAGVGAGTQIDHVEVVANTDDGFEWFGGTVNTSHLFALYCQDESFDLDEGHQGTHQFWFAVQSNNGDNLTEADGGNKTGTGVKTGEPLTNVMVYNATYIGALGAEDEEPQPIFDENGIPIGFGPAPEGGSADVFRLKDNFAGQFHNGIFMSPGDDIMRIDDTPTIDQVGGNLVMTYNLFGAPDDQATHNSSGDSADAEAAILAQDGNISDVQLGFTLLIRNQLGEVVCLDPRPVIASSPAWGGEVLAGAPQQVPYRGAFGTDLWVSTWTYASQEGIVVSDFENSEIPDATFIGEVIRGEDVEVISSAYDGTAFTINFVADPGASYKVTQSTTLTGAFTDVAEATVADASVTETISFEIAAASPKLFFRIEKIAD